MTGLLVVAMLAGSSAQAADLLDFFKRKPATTDTAVASSAGAGLSTDQIAGGLKEALGRGVQLAVASLGKPDGFLGDSFVKIPMPESLRKVEKGLRAIGQGKLADEFVLTMNRAAEQAVPEAAAVLGNSVQQLTVADAKSILTGTNTAATQYFRRTSETNLQARFLPLVKAATQNAGVTAAYKRMAEKAGGGLGSLGSVIGLQATDLDAYVTGKTLDGLFLKIAEQERKIRESPGARTTDLLQKVFGSVGK